VADVVVVVQQAGGVVVVDIIVLQAGIIVDMPQRAAGSPHHC